MSIAFFRVARNIKRTINITAVEARNTAIKSLTPYHLLNFIKPVIHISVGGCKQNE